MVNTAEAWAEADKTCYITKCVSATLDEIEHKHCVCVTGVPGAGKSTAIRHAALRLKKNGYFLYNINSPKQYMKFYCNNVSQVFLIDDIFGIHSVSKDEVQQWSLIREVIKSSLSTKTKFLISVRIQIINNRLVKVKHLEFLENTINLSDNIYKLDFQDMKGMLSLHLEHSDSGNVDGIVTKLWPSYLLERKTGLAFASCFPLLCKVFCTNPRQDPRLYFENPFQTLTNVFCNIQEEYYHQFCGLALCAFLEEKVTDDFFVSSSECNRHLTPKDEELRNAIMSKCKLKCPEDLMDVRCALECITGVYITRIGNGFSISHRLFHDIVVFLYDDPMFMFQYGSSRFIKDRVRIDKALPDDDQYVVVLDGEKYLERLVDRLVADYKSKTDGEWYIINNTYVDDDKFIACLKMKLFEQHDGSRTWRLFAFFKSIIRSSKTATYKKELIDDFFVGCMRSVWSNRDTNDLCDGDITVKQYKLIEFLLQEGADSNVYVDFVDRFPIHIATAIGSTRLTELLLRYGADKRRVVGTPAQPVLHSMCTGKQQNLLSIVKLITQRGDQSVLKFFYSGFKNEMYLLFKWRDSYDFKLSEVLSHNTYKVFKEHPHTKFSKIKEAVIQAIEFESGNEGIDSKEIIFDKCDQMEMLMSSSLKLEEIFADGSVKPLASGDFKKIKVFVEKYEGRNKLQLLHHIHDDCLNYVDENEKTVLHYLINTGNLEVVSYICGLRFTHLNHLDQNQKTILHYAAETTHVEIMRHLCSLPHLNHVNSSDRDGKHVLHYAIENGNLDAIRYLCSLPQFTCINKSDNEGKTILHYAVQKGDIHIIQYICTLIRCSCINDVDDGHRSVLHYAVRQGDIGIIYFLCNLPHFTRVNDIDDEGRTALHYALDNDNIDIIRYLCESTDFTAVNVGDSNGMTVLHYSVEDCCLETIKYVFTLPGLACKDACDNLGKTVLHYAVAKRDLEVIRFLIQLRVNYQSDKCGRTILQYAVNRGNMLVIKYLCSLSDIVETMNDCDSGGRNVLHFAVDNLTVTRYLLDTNQIISINQRDIEGRTPYYYIVNDIVPIFSLWNSATHGLKNRDSLLDLYKQYRAEL